MQQQMKLSPRIIQAMEILQLPQMALEERIEAELQSNPVLEMQAAGVDPEEPIQRDEAADDRGEHDMVVGEDSGHSEDFERLADFSDEYGADSFESTAPRPSRAVSGERDGKLDAMANTPAPTESLNEYLLQQWRFVECPEELRPAGQRLIDHIEPDGYLRTPLEEIAKAEEPFIPVQQLQEALAYVQQLEPLGVGARDVQECLLIQLAAEAQAGHDVDLEIQLIKHFLRDLELNRLPQIARRTGVTVEQIKEARENLSHLNPRPGGLIGDRSVPVISPDVVVDLDSDGQVRVAYPDYGAPRLYVSRSYRKMARNRDTAKDARKFIQRNIRSAEWLISAIEQRRETVGRVAQEVFEVQKDFLEQGPEALKPLPMADVAAKVGVHVATVSRAVAGKYAQTPRGIFPLRMFFSGGTTTAAGEDVSWDAVKTRLKEIIANEDKAKPLNDDKIVEKLKAEGIDIARRTVQKYRSQLGIPTARKRKEY